MKIKITVLLLLLTILLTNCSGLRFNKGEFVSDELKKYQQIIKAPKQTKFELYIKINSWFVEKFKSSESVIEFQDKDAGKIIGKYTFDLKDGIYFLRIKQTISIDIKNGKVRLTIKDPKYLILGDEFNGSQFYLGRSEYKSVIHKFGMEQITKEWRNQESSLRFAIKENSKW